MQCGNANVPYVDLRELFPKIPTSEDVSRIDTPFPPTFVSDSENEATPSGVVINSPGNSDPPESWTRGAIFMHGKDVQNDQGERMQT